MNIKRGSSWFNSLYEIQQRTLTFLLAVLMLTFLVPISPAYANGEPSPPIAIQGVTPPVAGATPVETITATSYYTGTVTWSDINGELSPGEKFRSNVIYGAYIVLSAISPYMFNDLNPYSFTVEGASTVLNDTIAIGENAAWVGINAVFIPLPLDAALYLDRSFPIDGPTLNEGAISIKDIFGESPLNDSNTAVGSLKVDRIAVDSQNRIVVLASFYDERGVDNHILFRLNANGSYDHSFGAQGPSLRNPGVENDLPKFYVLVTTTCPGYTERLDLEIDSQGKILVLLSGQAEGDACSGSHHNFVARYTSSGAIDPSFGTNGAIGTLAPQYRDDEPLFLFADLALDNAGHILVASLNWINFAEDEDLFRKIEVGRYLPTGLLDTSFGTLVAGTQRSGVSELEVFFPDGESPGWGLYRNVLMIPDNANPNGYVVAFTGATLPTMDPNAFDFQYTQLIRLDQNGAVVPLVYPFVIDPDVQLPEGEYVIPNFLLSDIVPDGPTGFIISGTAFLDELGQGGIVSLAFRIRIDGSADTDFAEVGGGNSLLSSLISIPCFNTALLRNHVSHQSSTGVVLGNFCDGDFSFRLKAFSSSGQFQGEFLVEDPTDRGSDSRIINQLIKTSDSKVLTLSGNRPTSGFFGYIFSVNEPQDYDWTDVVISRYQLPGLFTAPSNPPLGITGPEQVVGVVGTPINPFSFTVTGGTGTETITVTSGYALPAGLTLSSAGLISGTPTASGTTTTGFTVTDSSNETLTAYIEFVFTLDGRPSAPTPPPAPTPVPYLTTLTTPKLNLKDGKLICTPGTYNTGYTLNGVAQGSTTALFTPSTFTYNILINGIAQTSLTVTSNNSSHSWSMPTASAGALLTCSVTVTANGVTNTDRSSDNATAITTASLTHSNSLATANADYSAALAANTKAYQKALVDNRAQWRSTTEKIRTDYYAERDRIKSLPPTKATRALSSAALKSYTTAIKKGAADYKASQPAALAAKGVADKAALDAKTAAIAKANTTYGTFIESIGFGVLIP